MEFLEGFSICPINSHYMRFENIKLSQDRNVLLNLAFDHYTRSETTFQWGLECQIVKFSFNPLSAENELVCFLARVFIQLRL